MSDQELILTKSDKPYASFAAASMAFKKRGFDEKEYAVIECEGGWAISFKKNLEVQDDSEEEEREEEKALPDDGFSVIELSPASAGDIKVVPITVNGATLRIHRQKPVCLPNPYVEVLQHAVEIEHKQMDADEDDEIIERHRFPFRIIRKGSKEEFQKSLSKIRKRK